MRTFTTQRSAPVTVDPSIDTALRDDHRSIYSYEIQLQKGAVPWDAGKRRLSRNFKACIRKNNYQFSNQEQKKNRFLVCFLLRTYLSKRLFQLCLQSRKQRSSFLFERHSEAIKTLQRLICEAGYVNCTPHSIPLSAARYLHTSRITRRTTFIPETANGPTLLDTIEISFPQTASP